MHYAVLLGVWLATGAPAAITATGGNGQTVAASTVFALPLQAEVVDAKGAGVAGVTVEFAAPAMGASGTFAGGGATAVVVTDANGLATAPTFTANGVDGSYSVDASVSGIATPAVFGLTNVAYGFLMSISPTTNTISAGQVANFQLTVQPVGGFNSEVAFSCTGAPWPCTFSPAQASLAAGQTVAVSIATPTTSSSWQPWLWGAAAGLLLFSWGWARRRAGVGALAWIGLVTALAAGCGGNISSGWGSQPDNYSITVTGTSGGMSHSATLFLTVN